MKNMSRDNIYAQLEVERFEIQRRDCTPRVMARTDLLLDQLIVVQHDEAMELLEEEANELG